MNIPRNFFDRISITHETVKTENTLVLLNNCIDNKSLNIFNNGVKTVAEYFFANEDKIFNDPDPLWYCNDNIQLLYSSNNSKHDELTMYNFGIRVAIFVALAIKDYISHDNLDNIIAEEYELNTFEATDSMKLYVLSDILIRHSRQYYKMATEFFNMGRAFEKSLMNTSSHNLCN